MAAMSFGAPQPWPPPPPAPAAPSSCTPGICTTSCLQYCNSLFLQPPPQPLPQQQPQQFPLITNLPSSSSSSSDVVDDDSSSSRSISPLMASLIALLAASFLLLFYYTVLSRFCRRRRQRHRPRHPRPSSSSSSHRLDPMIHDPPRPESGLDESYIRQITVFKFKPGDGLVDATECAVCLADFADDESLRLMPNCEHAFHIHCIDTWLLTHSSCPLCRSSMNPLPARSAASSFVGVSALQVDRTADDVVVVDTTADVLLQVVVQVDVPHDDDRLKSDAIQNETDHDLMR